jgi:hypothetical protein
VVRRRRCRRQRNLSHVRRDRAGPADRRWQDLVREVQGRSRRHLACGLHRVWQRRCHGRLERSEHGRQE